MRINDDAGLTLETDLLMSEAADRIEQLEHQLIEALKAELNSWKFSYVVLREENETLRAKYEGALDSIREHQQLCAEMRAENENLKLRVSELENAQNKNHILYKIARDLYIQEKRTAEAERDRLQSECDLLRSNANSKAGAAVLQMKNE